MISERDGFTFATIVVLEVIVAIAACLNSGVGEFERHSSDLIACWQKIVENVVNFNEGRIEISSVRNN